MFFDTHAHYTDERFAEDREALLSALPGRGVGCIVNCGDHVESSRRCVELSRCYSYLYSAVGIHPESAGDYTEADLQEIYTLSREPKVVAIGEIGLDYYYEDGAPREQQLALLNAQLGIAVERNLPVVIHDREAHGDSLAAVKQMKNLRGVFHCYSGSVEMAQELCRLGWMFSFGGSCTFKNARKLPQVIAALPRDRIMLETDCPYLAPVPYRGQRCDSGMLTETCKAIARFRDTSPEVVEQFTWDNAVQFFGV